MRHKVEWKIRNYACMIPKVILVDPDFCYEVKVLSSQTILLSQSPTTTWKLIPK